LKLRYSMGQARRCRLLETKHELLSVVMHSRWRRPVALYQGEKPSSGPDPGSAKSSRIKTISSSGSGGIDITVQGVVDKAVCLWCLFGDGVGVASRARWISCNFGAVDEGSILPQP
jgi:hypothetical protein